MFSEKVKRLREACGWSRRELGRRIGKANGTHIEQIESGKRQNLRLLTVCELAKAFGISVDELIKDTEFDLMKGEKRDGKSE